MNRTAATLHALMTCAVLSWAGPASADAVTDWNEITVAAVTVGRPGPIGQTDIALVQIAVHDAVQAIEKRYEPYHAEIRGAQGKRSAAVAAAAHDMLVGMYPAQAASIDATYFAYLADNGLTGDAGIAVGQKAAASILPLRRMDPNPLPLPFLGGMNPGQWRPTPSFLGSPPAPPSGSAMLTPWLGEFDPFTLTSPRRFRADPPPALTSERYRDDYNEVKAVGALVSSTRTPAQTDVAYFWTDNYFAQSNRTLRAIATRRVNRIGDTARLFALANMAIADAVITSWDNKKFYAFWRPITAIREGDNDGNPATAGDPQWQPLINTPNYPDYTSGANNIVAALSQTLALYFGTDRITFEVTSLAPLAVQKTRTYRRFSDLQEEVVNARIYLGIHFRFADEAARDQGRRVARWTFDHFLLPRDGARYGSLDPRGRDGAAHIVEEYNHVFTTPWRNQRVYLENSPILNLDRVKAPLLMVVGLGDNSVPASQAGEVFVGLKRLGIKVALAEYPNATHVPFDWETRQQIDYAWYEEHLSPRAAGQR